MDATPEAEARAPRRLWQLPTWLVNRAALQAQRIANDTGIRRHHYAVLVALREQGPASQAALGRTLSIDRSDMTAMLDEFEHDGLVARTRDEHDRRRNLVRLTPAGTRALRQLDAHVDAVQDALLDPLSTAERRVLARLLTRVVEHHGGVARHDAPGARAPGRRT
ncbi:MAG TPA: MarR family transcriptional regulator [Conexibacter sp.]|nr:MarR family transcriptional regulator [Conexibacter sp.]